ncbi:MAG: NFACT family protein [Treponema sp.]|jgi:predicted ribosome quality control (RQC) complex YloA/Tae2 family protein|nr:NFACT family protein [Treponema sp.]
MSLNWKEIDLVLSELDLPGYQIQKAVQSAFDLIVLKLHRKGVSKTLLVSLSPGACRLHESFRAAPKSERPLRFAEFLNSRIANAWIEEAVQLGDNRIVRIGARRGPQRYRLYLRLWSNAANLIVTDEGGIILDAMRRLPRRGEVTGGRYAPEEEAARDAGQEPGKQAERREKSYEIRDFADGSPADLSFNRKIDDYYAEHGGKLSLDALREQARRNYEGRIGRLAASLERLREKEAEFASAEKLKQCGDIILANMGNIRSGDQWLETENFYTAETIRIPLEDGKSAAAQAERFYEQYRKAKSGLEDLREEIRRGEAELADLEKTLARLLEEANPLVLQKLLRSRKAGAAGGASPDFRRKGEKNRPGLSFRRRDWLILVGRDSSENDVLLRRHVKGNDLWLHARDFPGSYVFIKQRAGKSVPLDILLDAGNLAVFYSKGRNNGEGDLFYTPVKYLRRAKDGPKGLVLPTQEKNLHIKVDEKRLRELERCRVEK